MLWLRFAEEVTRLRLTKVIRSSRLWIEELTDEDNSVTLRLELEILDETLPDREFKLEEKLLDTLARL